MHRQCKYHLTLPMRSTARTSLTALVSILTETNLKCQCTLDTSDLYRDRETL